VLSRDVVLGASGTEQMEIGGLVSSPSVERLPIASSSVVSCVVPVCATDRHRHRHLRELRDVIIFSFAD